MKYDSTEKFRADFARLSTEERALFKRAVVRINAAYGSRGSRRLPDWPAALRMRSVTDHPNIYELTWSFSGPDGRATFEFITIGGEQAILWRRIGDHRIFRDP